MRTDEVRAGDGSDSTATPQSAREGRGGGLARRGLLALALSVTALGIGTVPTGAHVPSVDTADHATPDEAMLLPDPTLSRAIGSTISRPGEVDWYRMDLQAGDPLVVGMTAPDVRGGIAATFVLLGPGLPVPDETDLAARALMEQAHAEGAERFLPAAVPERQDHAGLAFLNYGEIRATAAASGTYWIVVSALDPTATGSYVLAPGVREEFTPAAIGGMADMVAFFLAASVGTDAIMPASPAPSGH
jgi:hypothetical protein